jgi:thimet oligopeptidase
MRSVAVMFGSTLRGVVASKGVCMIVQRAFIILGASALATVAAVAQARQVPPATPDSTPFYQGVTDEPSLERIVEARLDRAKRLLQDLLAVSGKRTPENTLRLYDALAIEQRNARQLMAIVQQLHPDPAMRGASARLLQRIVAFASDVSLNRAVFEALAAIDLAGASADVKYYVEEELADYRRVGVNRDDATIARLRQLRSELFATEQGFGRNIQEGVRRFQVEASDLDGLPGDFVAAHPPDAGGKIALTTAATDAGPVLTFAKRADLRRRMFMEQGNVAYPANVEVLRRMLDLRFQIARTLGYSNWASYSLEGQMAGTPATVAAFLDRVLAASAASATRDDALLLARKRLDHPDALAVESWDNAYYARLVRQGAADFDAGELRPYLGYDRVRDGLFTIAGSMYGFAFVRVTDAPVWHPAVEAYDVYEDKRRIGRLYLDTHPRPGKAGTDAGVFSARAGIAGLQLPELVLVARLPGGRPGDPGLMNLADVTLFFHEFGHVLHVFAISGRTWLGRIDSREHDFFETPSQLLEEWVTNPRVLAMFARHHQTGEPIPASLIERLQRSDQFFRGGPTRGEVVRAKFSLSLHDRDPESVEPNELYRDIFKRYLPAPFQEGRYFPAGFVQLRQAGGANHYRYLWSEVIVKDLFSQFDRANLLDPTVARRYKETVLAPGTSKPGAELVQDFLGRPFNVTAWENWLDEGDPGGKVPR